MYLVRATQCDGGGVGEGVLSSAEPGVERVGPSLHMAGVPLADIAEAVGTPVFAYNAETIRHNYATLQQALGPLPHKIHFAAKANGNLAVLRVLRDLGCGADLVSGGELKRALAAGFAPDRLIFSGVGKTDAELELAIGHAIDHIAVESLTELQHIGQLATSVDRDVRVAIRVNPDVTTETHPYISTGTGDIKFGLPVDQVLEAADIIQDHPRLSLTAVAMHLGSQLMDAEPYVMGTRHLLELVESLESQGVSTIDAIDVGGGLGIDYGDGRAMDVAHFGATLQQLRVGTGLTVYLEPGRFLVGNAGALVTRVLYEKHTGGKDFIVVDAGLNDFLRPSLYHAYHHVQEVEAHGRDARPVDVVGPVCETGDFFALARELPRVSRGELLAILGAGAYGFSMSSNYNSRARAAEVLVDGGRFGVARARESDESLFHLENPAPVE